MTSNHDPNNDLSRALEVLTIAQVWRAASHLPGQPPEHDGVVCSPFRDERRPSFSILGKGRFFKDFADAAAHGGVWNFGKLAWPDLSKRDLAQRLISLAMEQCGLVPAGPRPVASDATAGMTREQAAVFRKMQRGKEAVEARRRLEAERVRALSPKHEAHAVPAMPPAVLARWEEGVQEAAGSAARLRKLSADRGWPLEWAEQLVLQDKLGTPWLPWSGPDAREPKRGRACVVEMPVLDGHDAGAVSHLRRVGYHQRFWIDGEKTWVYVPHRPKQREGRGPAGEFMAALTAHAAELDTDPVWAARTSYVPALPFVLGSLEPEWVVIAEGQWDAITLAGAVGYFDDAWGARRVTFFGVRGASGMDVLLAYWGPWLARWRPAVWLLADADKAGRKWLERAPSPVLGGAVAPNVPDRLAHAGARRVHTTMLEDARYGKDFNDWYRAAQPSSDTIARWLHREGVLGAA